MSERICRGCGRTDAQIRKCRDSDGYPSSWVESDWCSLCEGGIVYVIAETPDHAERRRGLRPTDDPIN